MNAITLSPTARVALLAIAAATATGGFAYASQEEAQELVNMGFVEVNASMPEIVDGNQTGRFAARATDAGTKLAGELNAGTAQTAAPQTDAPKSYAFAVGGFNLAAGAVKTERKAPQRESKYPYAEVPAPSAENPTPGFFVPATPDMPEPWRSLASSVSNENRKHGVVTGTRTHEKTGKVVNVYDYPNVKFDIVRFNNGGTEGALIYRSK